MLKIFNQQSKTNTLHRPLLLQWRLQAKDCFRWSGRTAGKILSSKNCSKIQ